MDYSVKLVIIMEIFVICMLFTAMRLLLTGDGAKEQKLMGYFLCGSLVQNLGYMLELTATNLDMAVAAVKIENIGSDFIPLCYCWFIYGYCYEKPPKKLLSLIAVINFAMLPILFWCDQNTLYYRHMELASTASGHHYLNLAYGPLYFPFLFMHIVVPFLLSIYVLLQVIFTRKDKAAARQYKTILAISSLPVVALLSYTSKLMQEFDLSPLVLGLSLSSVVILLWSKKDYDFRHVASDVVLGSMGDGVIAVDHRLRLVSYNQAAVSIFPQLDNCKPGESIKNIESIQEEIFVESAPREFQIDSRYFESHAKQISDGNGKKQGYVVLILDVTDTKIYIEEIKRVRIQAEQANIAKSEFLANMSHEIRTPMNAIIGLSDIMMEESLGTKIYSHAQEIQSAAKSLLAIINDILDLSKIEAGKMELVQSEYYLKAVVNDVVKMMDMAASQRGLIMKYEYDETIPCQYYGDEGRIRQILINLLNNAVKFTNEGYVRIEISGRPGNAEDEEMLIFQISDTGRGILQKDQDIIFEDFKQADSKQNRSAEGTGLGLSIVKRLLLLMDGDIHLESTYGVGTTFTITIPQKIIDKRTLAQMPEIPAKEAEQIESFTASSYKVLIVDDNLINRKVAKGFLKSYGFELAEAESGPEAIRLVKNIKFDLIFMDHMMPEMDGIETVANIRKDCGENGSAPIIIALTANAMEGVREMFLSRGFHDFIAKPLEREALNKLLIKWIPEKHREVRKAAQPDQSEMLDPAAIQIEGIDMGEAMKYQTGSMADYMDLLELYCIDGKRKIALLAELAQNKNYHDYEIEVHGLKSSSANIGAARLSTLAREHEEAAMKGDYAFITNGYHHLLASYERQLMHIQQFLDTRQGAAGQNEDALADIGQQELVHGIREALDSLENFRSKECARKIKELLGYRLEDTVSVKLKEIQEQLKLYEDDEAEQLLHQLLDYLA